MNGEEISAVQNCVDVDLNFSPVTNTLPIRRLNLESGSLRGLAEISFL